MASGDLFPVRDRILCWLCAPLNTLQPGLAWLLTVGAALFVSVGALRVLSFTEPAFAVPDTSQYLNMARGQIALVHQPFASRPLEPLLARGLSAWTGMDVRTAFAVLAWMAFLATLLTVFHLAMRSEAPRWFVAALGLLPFWPELLHGMALPDVWYAGLLSCLLLLLSADRPVLAALMLFPLMASRESTSLTLVCLLAACWRRLGWKGCLLAVLAAGAGSMLVRHLSAGAQPNAEGLPQTLYLLFKAPWNLVRTLGIQPWSNLYPYLCSTPVWQHSLHIGPLRAVGVCTTSRTAPREAATALMTTYGLFPVLLVLLWRGRRRICGDDLLLRFSLLYGGVSFLIVPLLGTWYLRFAGYAWPLFLVALPRLYRAREGIGGLGTGGLGGGPRALGWTLAVFLALQIGLGRMAYFFQEPGPVVYGVPIFLAGIVLLVSRPGRILLGSRAAASGPGVVKSG